MPTRLERLRSVLQEQELPGLLISDPANRRYISGFSGSTGLLLVTPTEAIAITDSRYRLRIAQEAPAFTLRENSTERTVPKLVAEAVQELGLPRLAFEAAALSYAGYQEFARGLQEQFGEGNVPPELVPVQGVVESLREVKDDDELATLRKAVAITDAALAAVLPELRPDHSERQAAWMLEVAMRERGADGPAFPIIVAAGENSARPHAQAGDNLLGSGQPIVIDMGARLDGYHADMTRTIVLGQGDDQFHTIYNLVLRAQLAAIAKLRAGMRGYEGDALARTIIAEAGHGDNFGHGLGHGVGLNIHEGPSLRRVAEGKEESSPVLRAGNVTSVEPGVYIEGWGGVRIEDLVVITETGCEVLTGSPK
jgi:Xaa-Pro aminopeptidase